MGQRALAADRRPAAAPGRDSWPVAAVEAARPVAVLALQGDFEAHRRALLVRGLPTREARNAVDLDGVAGIVLPGGESTTMLKLMAGSGLSERVVALAGTGVPVFATCAGVVLVAREVRNPGQRSLGMLDVEVERNAYGRQIDSAVARLTVDTPELLGTDALEGVFIRAPRITAVGPTVRVLARRGTDPVLVRQGNLLAATFHPELSPASPVVDLFCAMVRGES